MSDMIDKVKRKRRKTGGRKKHNPPLHKYHITMTEEQARLLRMWGRGDLCAGLRWLIDVAAPLVHKPVTDDPHSNG